MACMVVAALLRITALAPPAAADDEVRDVIEDHRPPGPDESLEQLLLASDVVCLARVLRVNTKPVEQTIPKRFAEIVYEPVEFVKGALDYDDSMSVAFAPDSYDSPDQVRKDAIQPGAALLLFFYDAGGYWKLANVPMRDSSVPPGYLRVAPGQWSRAVAHARWVADRITLEALVRRADRIVVGTSRADPAARELGTGTRVTHHYVDVSETLKGSATDAPPHVRSWRAPPRGRQLWFLVDLVHGPGGRGLEETIPYAAPSWRPMRPDSTRVPEVTDAEVAQVRAIVAAQAKEVQ